MSQNTCRQCGKKITGNKIYCSNKGPGNCKDLYHNLNNPRGYGLIENDHPNSLGDEDPGWDAHKGTF